MSKELLDLLAKINSKKQEVKDLCDKGKLDEAEKAKKELKDLNKEFDLRYDLDAEDQKEAEEKAKEKSKTDNKKQIAFARVFKAFVKKENPKEEDLSLYNEMSEGSGKDGGLLVPQDIRTEVKELRRSVDSLEEYADVEPVTTVSGSRPIEKDAEHTPFDNVDEGAEFPEDSTPQFVNVEYKCKKKGGILKLTRELLEDAAENILKYVKNWIAKKSKATRNFMIIKKIKDALAGKEVVIESLDDLQDIFDIMLDPDIAAQSFCFTNQYGSNYLNKLKDKNDRPLLQPDPTEKGKKMLFGEYPMVKLSKRTLKNVEYNNETYAPAFCGSLKEFLRIFDREKMTIEISSEAGDLWLKDKTGVKVRERLDVQVIDEDALVYGLIPVSNAPEETIDTPAEEPAEESGPLTAEQLAEMTKAQILAAAVEAGYELEVTESNTKDEIIAAYLAAAEAAANA